MRVKMRSVSGNFACRAGTNEPICAISYDQRGLSKVGGFAAHVRAGDQKQLLSAGLEAQIVGHKAFALLSQQFFDYRMPTADDQQFTGAIEFRARIVAVRRHLCERGQHIQLRDGRSSFPQAPCFRGNPGSHIDIQLPFDFQDAFVSRKDFPLVSFQFRRSESFGVHQGLLAFVILGRVVQIGLARFRCSNRIPD